MMIALKVIHPPFSPTNSKYDIHSMRLSNRSSILCLCKSNEFDSQPTQPGDTRKQELLAQIAMIEAQKVRLMDYLDERSSYLTEFGEEAKAEFDKIGEDVLKGLDEADARITANIESQMLEFEETAEVNRQEIRSRENKLEEFEVQIEDGRNEGLFFKNLRKKKPVLHWPAELWNSGGYRLVLHRLEKSCSSWNHSCGSEFSVHLKRK